MPQDFRDVDTRELRLPPSAPGLCRGPRDRRPVAMTPTTQHELLEKLACLWELSPDVRFGQFLANIGFLVEDQTEQSLRDVEGFWCCPVPGCSGTGFGFDILPVDPN